jgi:predicted DCC family thiol-disulfide oxidoreductase YuxK
MPKGAQLMEKYPILFFDGVCNLCNGTVDFIISHDKKSLIRFAPLQGTKAKEVLGPILTSDLKTVVLFYEDKIYVKSNAILKTLQLLGFPYNLILISKIFPPFIRNFFYDFIAKNRYKFFGQKETCRLPSASEKKLFLD